MNSIIISIVMKIFDFILKKLFDQKFDNLSKAIIESIVLRISKPMFYPSVEINDEVIKNIINNEDIKYIYEDLNDNISGYISKVNSINCVRMEPIIINKNEIKYNLSLNCTVELSLNGDSGSFSLENELDIKADVEFCHNKMYCFPCEISEKYLYSAA